MKKLEDNPQTGKENSFILPASSCPPGQTAQCPEEPPQPETVLLTGKRITGWVISFPSLSEHCTNDLLWIHPTQRLAKLRHPETTRSKERRVGAVSVNHTAGVTGVLCILLCKTPPEPLLWGNQLSAQSLKTPENSAADHSPRFYISRLQLPEYCLVPLPPTELLQPVTSWDPGPTPTSE